MNRPVFGALGVLAVLTLTVGSCKSDPFSDLDNGPAALVVNFTHLQIAVGGTVAVTASVVDGRATPLPLPLTFTACDASVSTTIDPDYHPIPETSTRGLITALIPAPTCVIVRGGGFEDTVSVTALPSSFTGALSSLTPMGGDTLKIASTAQLKFDTATVAVTFGGANPATGIITSKTADTVKVIVPFTGAAQIGIAGVLVTSYSPPLAVTLFTTAGVTQTGDRWAASASWQTAPDISGLLPPSGANRRMIVTRGAGDNSAVCPEAALGFGSTGPCMMFKYTVATTTTLNFATDWEGTAAAPDVDIYVCSDSTVANFGTACFVDGGSGATGVKPQTTGNDAYAPGTYWFVVEIFDGGGPRNAFITISRP